LQGAEKALLRFVHDSTLRWRSEELSLQVNGTEVPLNVETDYLVEVSVPLDLLQEKNQMTFSLRQDAEENVLLCTASLILKGMAN
jgi:hypothetical protein